MAWEISRRSRGENYQPRRRNYHYGGSRPPRDEKPYFPPLEKKFCSWLRGMSWYRILERLQTIHWYGDILKWSDSAAEEAFLSARNRFWAEINGLPCDDKLPDPDLYIDEIDWDAETDIELLLDLEREDHVSDKFSEEGGIVNLESALGLTDSFAVTGWGDYEPVKRDDALGLTDCIPGAGWDDDQQKPETAVEFHSDENLNKYEKDYQNHHQSDEVVKDGWWDSQSRKQWAPKDVNRYSWDNHGDEGHKDRDWDRDYHESENLNKYDKDHHNHYQSYEAVKVGRWSSQNKKQWIPKGSKQSSWDNHGDGCQREWGYGEAVKQDTKYWNDNGDSCGRGGWKPGNDCCSNGWRKSSVHLPPHPLRGYGVNKGRKGGNLVRGEERQPFEESVRLPSYWRW